MEDDEYSSYFDKIFKEMTRGMSEHSFKHYNSSMGIHINGKAHYYHEMKKRRMVPYAETERLAEQWDKEHPHKNYDSVSPKAMDIIRSLRQTADKNGNIYLGGIAIKAMINIGAISSQSEHRPKELQMAGGFN